MSAKKLFPYHNRMLDAQQIADMCYPKLRRQLVLKLLAKEGTTVQDVLEYDTTVSVINGRKKARAVNKQNGNDFQVKEEA